MSHDTEQKLETLLKSRPFIPAHDGLADRIVAAAKSLTQKKEESVMEWIQGLFTDFIDRKPAYVLGLLLTLGLCLGFVGTVQEKEQRGNHKNVNHMQGFLYMNRSLL